MPTKLRKLFQLIFGVLFLASFALASRAQEATVIRNVNLRSDPSTSNPPIRLITPSEKLTLLGATKTNGYYHVKTHQDEEGWAWGPNLKIASVSTLKSTSSGASVALPLDWEKPDPVTSDFQAEDGTCGPAGSDLDTPTNLRKNRTDVPASYHEIPFDSIAGLAFPKPAPTKRISWSPAQLDEIKPDEGVAISIVGYLAAVKKEKAESTNCGWTKADEVDWHLALVKDAGDGEPEAIVVEVTPRIRVSHPGWTFQALSLDKTNQTQVRISGWLMLDPDHPSHLGKYRITLWEIHPITKIEGLVNGQWVDLDQ
jgi:uncharacterized protein YgiM (DUF1202 family)